MTALDATPEGAPVVWVIEGADNRVSPRPIGIGEARGASVAVVEGLDEGDVVVTAGISKLREGMRVKPIATAAE